MPTEGWRVLTYIATNFLKGGGAAAAGAAISWGGAIKVQEWLGFQLTGLRGGTLAPAAGGVLASFGLGGLLCALLSSPLGVYDAVPTGVVTAAVASVAGNAVKAFLVFRKHSQ